MRQKRETCLLRVAYIYIYITTVSFIDSFRLESVSIEGNRATVATLHRLLIPKLTPYPTRDTPLSLYIYIFIDSCRGKIRVFPFLRHRRTNLENTNLDLVLFRFEATDFSKCSSHRFERWKKGTRRKERRRRKSEVLTGGAKQFDSHPGRREFGDAKLRGNCEKRSCKEKLRRIKKRRSWFPSPPPRGGRISSPPQRSTAVYFSAK